MTANDIDPDWQGEITAKDLNISLSELNRLLAKWFRSIKKRSLGKKLLNEFRLGSGCMPSSHIVWLYLHRECKYYQKEIELGFNKTLFDYKQDQQMLSASL